VSHETPPAAGASFKAGVPRRTVTASPPIMMRSASMRTLTYCDLNADCVSAPDRRIGYDGPGLVTTRRTTVASD